MLNSARRGISYPNPDRSDRPDIPAHILALVNALEIDVIFAQGTSANRLAAAHMAGVIWRETDTGLFYWDTGVAWVPLATMIQDGLFANRPLANAVPVGARYFATDTGGTWRSDGATWTLIDQHARLVTTAEFAAAPYNAPYDGMEARILVDAAAGVIWHVRYNSSSASTYKWEVVSAGAMSAQVATAEVITNQTTYGNLATVGPSITVPRSGQYRIEFGFTALNSSGAGNAVRMSVSLGAAAAVDADAASDVSSPSHAENGHRALPLKALVASDAIQAKYRVMTTSQFTVSERYLMVTPLRIS